MYANRNLIVSKYEGRLPNVPWVEVFRLSLPKRPLLPGPLAHLPSIHRKSERGGACPALWRTPMGEFWGRLEERGLGFQVEEQYLHDVYEEDPVVVRRGDTVLDAGANLGTFTKFALDRGASRVIAFEPEPTNIACRRITTNRLPKRLTPTTIRPTVSARQRGGGVYGVNTWGAAAEEKFCAKPTPRDAAPPHPRTIASPSSPGSRWPPRLVDGAEAARVWGETRHGVCCVSGVYPKMYPLLAAMGRDSTATTDLAS